MSRSKYRKKIHRAIHKYKDDLIERYEENGCELHGEQFSTIKFPPKYFDSMVSDYKRCGITIYNIERHMSGVYFSMIRSKRYRRMED